MIAIGMIVKTLKNVVSRFNGWSGYSMSSWTGWSSVIAARYGGSRRRARHRERLAAGGGGRDATGERGLQGRRARGGLRELAAAVHADAVVVGHAAADG